MIAGASITSYEDLVIALRERAEQLGLSREELDARTGLQSGYSAKLLTVPPIKRFGRISLGPMLGALGLEMTLRESPGANHLRQETGPTRSVAKRDLITFKISRKRLKNMARKGGKNSAKNLTAKQRSERARKGAIGFWRKRRLELNRQIRAARVIRRARRSSKLNSPFSS